MITNSSFFFIDNLIIAIAAVLCGFFIFHIALIKKKDLLHWIFIIIVALFFLRMISFNLLVIPAFSKSENIALLFHRIQRVSVLFLPALFSHLFHTLLYQNKKQSKTIPFLYFLSLFFYILVIIGVDPATKEFRVENNNLYLILNTSSNILKTVILFFIISYIYSIYILNKLSNTKMTNKDRKIFNLLKWTYIITFGYGYIIQFFMTIIFPDYLTLTSYLITIFLIVLYYTIRNCNFLKTYSADKYLHYIHDDFSAQFIITDSKGNIVKSNVKNINNCSFKDMNVFAIFPESADLINSVMKEKKCVQKINLSLINIIDMVNINYSVDINIINDEFMDFIGLFIILNDYKISIDSFSKREQEVISKLLENRSYKEIAYELNISYNTVNTHIKNIYKKSFVSDRNELLEALSHIQ